MTVMNLETSDVSWSFASNCKKSLIELFFFKRSFKEIASKFSLPTLHSFLWKSYDILNVYSSLISTTYLQTFTFFRNLIWQICSCILVLQRYVHVVLSMTLHATTLVPQREIEESTP